MELQPKKRQYLYLGGAINNDPRTYEWREKFTELMKDEPHIVVINPCASKFSQGVRHVGNTGMEYIAEINKQSQKLLRSRDYQFLRMSSIMLVNFGFCTPDKPLIGTLQELTWAADLLFLPIIAITNGETNAYTEHPWISECVSAKVETVEDAADMIKKFFLEY